MGNYNNVRVRVVNTNVVNFSFHYINGRASKWAYQAKHRKEAIANRYNFNVWHIADDVSELGLPTTIGSYSVQ